MVGTWEVRLVARVRGERSPHEADEPGESTPNVKKCSPSAREHALGVVSAPPEPRPSDGAGDPGRAQRDPQVLGVRRGGQGVRSEEHTSELQSLMRTSYAVFS